MFYDLIYAVNLSYPRTLSIPEDPDGYGFGQTFNKSASCKTKVAHLTRLQVNAGS